MTKKTVKSLLMTAAVSGLMTGGAITLNAQTAPSSSQTSVSSSSIASLLQADDKSKHACKGQNDCKGQGGCKAGDNGCKGKNSCKGKGGCATDGSEDARVVRVSWGPRRVPGPQVSPLQNS